MPARRTGTTSGAGRASLTPSAIRHGGLHRNALDPHVAGRLVGEQVTSSPARLRKVGVSVRMSRSAVSLCAMSGDRRPALHDR